MKAEFSQPVPTVSRDDVQRVAQRDFPASFAHVLEMLGRYGEEEWHREIDRVHLAVLKLAAGDPDRLRTAIETAWCDYRDVLAAAEYPEYGRSVRPGRATSAGETERIIAADWKQYREWLTRN